MSIRGVGAVLLLLAAVFIGADSSARVFYCGSITFNYSEEGGHRFEDRPQGGGYTKINQSLNLRYGGTWPICMECSAAENSPVFLCSGQSIGSLDSFQFYLHEDSEFLKAGVQCNNRYVQPGPRTTSVSDTTGAAPSEVPIAAALNVVGSEYHLMAGPGGDLFPQISGMSRGETKTAHPCGPSGTEDANDAFNLPLAILFSATQPWVQGDRISGVLPIEDVDGCTDSSAEICSGCGGKGHTCDYRKQAIAQWSLKRRVSDCTARVSMKQGDVQLNGDAIPRSGEIPLAQGDVITSGRGARASFKISGTAIMQVGPSSRVQLNRDMCDQTPSADVTEDLLTGPAAELFLYLSGTDNNFEIRGITSAGVRGSLKPRREQAWSMVSNAHAAPIGDALPLDPITLPADWPGGGRALYLKSEDSGRVVVKALRGRLRVQDRDANQNIELRPGEIYRSPALSRKNPVRVTMLGKGSD